MSCCARFKRSEGSVLKIYAAFLFSGGHRFTLEVYDRVGMDLDPDTHPVRITTHGKIKTWVQFALNFLDVRRFPPNRSSHSALIGE